MKAAYKELDFSAHAVQLLVRRINSEKQANEFLTRIYYYELTGPTRKGRYCMIDDKTIWYCFYFIKTL